MSTIEHKAAAGNPSVPIAVLTCSDTRTVENDKSGQMIQTLLQGAGHNLVFYAVVREEPESIREMLKELIAHPDVHAIILNGGTGFSSRDSTVDIVSTLLTKTMPGFGEIFRMLSYSAVGSSAILSRATAGLADAPLKPDGTRIPPTLLFAIPGSPNAVETALTELILPELAHLIWEVRR